MNTESIAAPAVSDTIADPHLVWTLKRNCALTPRQFLHFYCLLALVSLSVAAFWASVGAWTVLPFSGVELLALGVAFLIYVRHATDYERIELSVMGLIVDRVEGQRVERFEMNPRWVRVQLEQTPRPLIELRYAGKVVLIGRHVPHHLRAPLAQELRRCLLTR